MFHAFGVDAVQALILALRMVHAELLNSPEGEEIKFGGLARTTWACHCRIRHPRPTQHKLTDPVAHAGVTPLSTEMLLGRSMAGDDRRDRFDAGAGSVVIVMVNREDERVPSESPCRDKAVARQSATITKL
ncbi:hypothetical protein HCN58_24000 [Bradyrhizobium sp. WSM 1791]|uniref:DUF6968 domain-containing protein n=1 Tax=Bradyrhizobium australiense TaxID=2721161 RepID=A0A7Y4GWF7_9BRAD|nr:hypothetical protein [Bradyrhizobium australiense]NOJ42612.1 hypothetical protein [Bradyrhizobium australiense]